RRGARRAARRNAPDPRGPCSGRLSRSGPPGRRGSGRAAGRSAVTNADRACVVLPTYDERDNLPSIVPAILAASPELDVLAVDDGSPDGTGALADEMAGREPRVRVLHRQRKEGLGRAYLAGFDVALRQGYGRILEMDADFSHDP